MTRSDTTRLVVKLGVALGALAIAQAAAAQASETPAAAAPQVTAGTDGDIVVTARRRAETLRDVPIAISAISGAQLDASGIHDIVAVAQSVPNLSLKASRGTNSTLTAFIRGVGQQDPVAGFESGVGLYLDDVYLNRPQAAVLDVIDVERIEVLRGPQGTLYGRNTIGGAVKYVTRRINPKDAVVSLRATYGNYNEADGVISASTPITDNFRVGGSLARLSHDGFGHNLTNGLDNYNKDVYAARISAELEPIPDLSLRFSSDYVKDNSNPRNGSRLIPGLQSGAPVLASVYDTRAGLNTPKQSIEAYGFSGIAELKLSSSFTLKSITAYRRDTTSTSIDFDSLPAQDVDVPAIYKNKQFSQEGQLLYSSDRLNGLVGIYYLDATAFNIFDVILDTTGRPIGLPGLTASTLGNVGTKTWSVFGDFTFDVADRLSVSAGGRYTNDQRTARIFRRNLIGGASPDLGGTGVQLGNPTSDFDGTATFKQFTPRASISFKPTPNHNIYASYSQGFKGGGFDPRGLTTAAPDTNGNGTRDPQEIYNFLLFKPEKVDSYELGWKAKLLDNRVNFSLASFYATYTDVQIPSSVGALVGGVQTFVGITTNAGKAEFKGVEFEGLAKLAPEITGAGSNLNFAWSLGYIDAKYKNFINTVGVEVSQFRQVQNTPKWTASGTLTLSTPLTLIGAGQLDISPSLSYRSRVGQFETVSPLDQPGYTLLDTSIVWRSDSDRWSVGLHGKNLTDVHYRTGGYQFLAINPTTGAVIYNAAGNPRPTLGKEGVLTAFYGNPRQFYVTVGLKF
ncbi:MAG: TonB-dependent receptor [Sphingomonadaceae bacterium]|nr:TonB-dependent receptor [Sphingomonadaceae bacterium]